MTRIAAQTHSRLAAFLIACSLVFFLFAFFAPALLTSRAQDDPPAENNETNAAEPAKAAEQPKVSSNIFMHIIKSLSWFAPIMLVVSIALIALIMLLIMELRVAAAERRAFGQVGRCLAVVAMLEPGRRVDAVDALVHEGAAAVELPGAAPAALVVVLLGAIPLDGHVAEDDAAEAPAVEGVLEQAARLLKAAREDGAERHAGLAASAHDGINAVERDLDGLLNHDVAARLGGRSIWP